jgi:DNA-binding IclR family transcriptional regulator
MTRKKPSGTAPPGSIPQEPARRRQKVQSAETGMAVLKALGALGGAATLTTLAAKLEEHPAKVHRYLGSLVSTGFVFQDPMTSRYVLGPEAIAICLAAQRQSDPLTLAAQEIVSLAETLNVSCFVAVMGNLGPVIVRWEEPMQSVLVNVRVGSVMPVLWSATGRCFAAFQKSEQLDALITRELAMATEDQRRMLPNRKAVDALLASYRAKGCTWVVDTLLKGVSGVAAPVFNAAGQVPAVIVALGVTGSFDARPDGANALAVRRSAAEASLRLGHPQDRAA